MPAYLTLAGRKRAMARVGQTRSGLVEDGLVVAAGFAVVAFAVRGRRAPEYEVPGSPSGGPWRARRKSRRGHLKSFAATQRQASGPGPSGGPP